MTLPADDAISDARRWPFRQADIAAGCHYIILIFSLIDTPLPLSLMLSLFMLSFASH
jgi:hypothetical protein